MRFLLLLLAALAALALNGCVLEEKKPQYSTNITETLPAAAPNAANGTAGGNESGGRE